MPPEYFKWNYDSLLKLLSLLRLHPVLWDSSLTNYTNKNERYIALESIASEMETTRDIIKRKIHTLRSQYTKEQRMIRKNPNYKPKWQMFEKVKFLYKHDKLENLEGRSSDEDDNSLQDLNHSTFKNDTFSSEDYDSDSYFDASNENTWSMTAESCENFSTKDENKDFLKNDNQKTQVSTLRRPITPPAQPILDENEIETSLNILRVQCDRDEFMIFGENVANELRLLKDHKPIQLALKCKILRAIVEANEALHRALWFR